MNVETRKTSAGTEYWDNVEKRIRFVPAGQKPDFEVTENPKSMIMGVDMVKSQDNTTVDGKVIERLEDMTVPKLKEYAESKDIELPDDVKKKDDIVQYIYDNWKSDEVE